MFTTSLAVFIFGLIAAIAGGAVGGAIGGNYAFVLTGFSVIVGWAFFAATGNTFGLDVLAFGPFFGPHVCFVGGVAAAAYARYRGVLPDGRDINSAPAGFGQPQILLIGSLFGALGYVLQIGIAHLGWFGTHTDTVALTVVTLNIVARWAFGGKPNHGLFKGSVMNREKLNPKKSGLRPYQPSDTGRWLKWQEKTGQYVTIGAVFGIFAGVCSLFVASNVGASLQQRGLATAELVANNAQSLTFGISAIIIFFLIVGFNVPVQHHVTITAGLAAVKFFPVFAGSDGFTWTATSDWDSALWTAAIGALIVAALAGMMAAAFAEVVARLFYNRGVTHIDPPAGAIWISNTITVSAAALLSAAL